MCGCGMFSAGRGHVAVLVPALAQGPAAGPALPDTRGRDPAHARGLSSVRQHGRGPVRHLKILRNLCNFYSVAVVI